MHKSLFFLFSTCCSLAAARPATAQTAAPGTTARQTHERGRTRQGVASGQLTRPEAARLRAREADIHQDKAAARADGVVTHDERQDIRQDTRQTSRAIYHQKHDGQVRARRLGR